jgi:predicted ABC-type ATPase
MRDLIAAGYVVDVTYLWLPSADDAVARVRFRVERQGGHYVPEEDVRRRFDRSLINFETVVRPLATQWHLSDAREPRTAPMIAEGIMGELRVRDAERWVAVLRTIEAALAGQQRRNRD